MAVSGVDSQGRWVLRCVGPSPFLLWSQALQLFDQTGLLISEASSIIASSNSKPLDSGTQSQPNLHDEETFNLIFRTHYASLASFAMGYVGEKETAEEIVQDVFTRIWENAESIEIRTSIKSYLFGAVRFACLNVLKHEKTRQKYLDRQQTQSLPNAIDFLELDELQEKIDQGMNKLPEKCREIFELSRNEGLKYQEIADRLQLSIKTVENQMGKALKTLREELAEYLPFLILFVSEMGVNQSFIVELLQR